MSDYNRIAKNAGFLYIRMLINLFISLYTSRLILQALGVVDFGIYNVVGGIISMIAFFQSTLTNVGVRFFSYELGKEDISSLKSLFRFCFSFFFLFGIISLIIAIPIGFYMVNNVLTIPIDRILAAKYVFIFSIITFFISVITITFNASIIAHEKMNIYAYIGMFQAISKLIIAYLLTTINIDRLILYGLAEVFINITILIFYWLYVRKFFIEYSIKFYLNKSYIKLFFPFISWNLIGCGAWAINQQGINFLLNIFFSPAINAARGISAQVTGLTKMFSSSIYSAFSPQIIKNYSNNNLHMYRELFFNSSRYSFFMSWVISLPVMLNLSFLLNLWLVEVPEATLIMTILTITFALIDILNEPIWTAVQASGHIRNYQLWGNIIFVLSFPFSFLLLYCGYDYYSPFYVLITIRLLYIFIIFYIVRITIKISYHEYINNVIRPILLVVAISLFLCLMLSTYLPLLGVLRFIILGTSSFIITLFTVYIVGINKKERIFIINKIKTIRR